MTRNIERVRLGVFKIWFVTLGIVIVVYVGLFAGVRGVPPPFSVAFQSLQIMIGLVVPQIGVMAAFYFNLDRQQRKIEALTKPQVLIITSFSVAYHIIFNLALVGGVVFYVFDRTADGQSLQRNTAAVVAIMGLFSAFLTPVAFLFARPEHQDGP